MALDFAVTGAPHASLRTTNSQVAAIPLRWSDGAPEVLLITSRGRSQWIVPKGWALMDCLAAECAAREAYEEAGVTGEVEQYSLGAFEYFKQTKQGRLYFEVTAYALHVERVLADWPERNKRRRSWFAPDVAAQLTGNESLSQLIKAAVQVEFKPAARPQRAVGLLN
ncbi:MAG: NUDIX hydrolase [Phycisphaerales bacterium]|nr:NUDIX hydrolase [Hyphomonadaceae bacterium]